MISKSTILCVFTVLTLTTVHSESFGELFTKHIFEKQAELEKNAADISDGRQAKCEQKLTI